MTLVGLKPCGSGTAGEICMLTGGPTLCSGRHMNMDCMWLPSPDFEYLNGDQIFMDGLGQVIWKVVATGNDGYIVTEDSGVACGKAIIGDGNPQIVSDIAPYNPGERWRACMKGTVDTGASLSWRVGGGGFTSFQMGASYVDTYQQLTCTVYGLCDKQWTLPKVNVISGCCWNWCLEIDPCGHRLCYKVTTSGTSVTAAGTCKVWWGEIDPNTGSPYPIPSSQDEVLFEVDCSNFMDEQVSYKPGIAGPIDIFGDVDISVPTGFVLPMYKGVFLGYDESDLHGRITTLNAAEIAEFCIGNIATPADTSCSSETPPV